MILVSGIIMKANVLDILVYLFDTYFIGGAQVPEDGGFNIELHARGFSQDQIDQAANWFLSLAKSSNLGGLDKGDFCSGKRIYSDYEQSKINVDCRGYLQLLEDRRVISSSLREFIIDRVMALPVEEIELDVFKRVVGLVVFNHPAARDYFYYNAASSWQEYFLRH